VAKKIHRTIFFLRRFAMVLVVGINFREATPLNNKSFGGVPNSRNVLFLQIFLKRAAKPSAANTSAGFPR